MLSRWKTGRLAVSSRQVVEPLRSPAEAGQKAKLLFCSSLSGFTGAGESLAKLVAALPKDRFECFGLLGAEGHFAEQLRMAGATVRISGHEFISASAQTARTICDTLAEVDPQIMHLNGHCGVIAPLAAKFRGTSVVYHVRHCKLSKEVVEGITLADHIICVSDYVKARLRANDVSPRAVTTVYDGVDTGARLPLTDVQKAAAKGALGIGNDRVVVLLVARYDQMKRHDLLLQAAARLSDRRPLHVVLVGESFNEADLSWECHVDQLIGELGLEDRVTRLPFQANLAGVQAAADIVVLCSEEEALGTSVLEAMAMAIPVIVSDRGGLPEIVVGPSPAGIVTKTGDLEQLTSALDTLASDEATRDVYGRNGRTKSVELFDSKLIAYRVSEVYESLIMSMARMPTGRATTDRATQDVL